jgi:Holliday junction resolvase-like predicted endonuclease/phage tail protein X
MAVLIPSMVAALRRDGGMYRELDLVHGMAASLPDGYEVYHGMALHTVRDGHDYYGEIDVVVMAPTGALLLMEVKAGAVVLRDGMVYKAYADGEHDVSRQCRLQRASLLARLHDARLDTSVASCLVLPDYQLADQQPVSVPRERIIDAALYPQVCSLVREWLAAGKGCARLAELQHFLRNQFRVTPDLAAARDQLERTTRILSDGLATWVPRIVAPSGVLRIQATAGSGKTQLALRILETALAEGRSAAYVCFNRTLGDYIRARAPVRAQVVNFHELAVEHVRRVAGEPDFTEPSVLERAAARYVEDSAGFAARFDVLVIDEGQDFEPAWIASLCQLLRADGALYLLEDDDQRLYHRDDFDIAGATVVASRDNYRSPRLVCDVINALRLSHRPVNGMSPYKGELPGWHRYGTTAELVAQIECAVTGLLARGFALADIVVVSNRGRASSALTGLARIGPWTTRQFTGNYDRNGEPLWTDGELMVESVYRYKGQSAPAVVLAEVAFDELTPHEKKKLFVGLTRAQMAVELVLTNAAEQTLAAALDHGAGN